MKDEFSKTKTYSMTLQGNVAEQIKKLAAKDNRSFSQFINLILVDYINAKEEEERIKAAKENALELAANPK